MKKYIFINDTRTQSNWGCHSTSYCFEKHFNSLGFKCSGRVYLKDLQGNKMSLQRSIKNLDIAGADCVFVNGEGSIYDSQIKGLMMLEAIKEVKKINNKIKIFVVNSTYDLTSPLMIRKVKEVRDLVSLFAARENVSLNNMQKIGINNVILQPDFLYDKKVETRDPKPYIVLGGNSNYYRRDRKPYDAISAYRMIVRELQKLNREIVLYSSDVTDKRYLNVISDEFGLRHVTADGTNWVEAMDILSQSSLSISGRYHPTIMSLCGHTPCYMISANNCKMEGTHNFFYENGENFSNSHEIALDCKKIFNWAESTLENYDEEVGKVEVKLIECRRKLSLAKEAIYDNLR